MKYKTIFFDLDGTITDSAPGIMNSIKYALEKNHLPMLSEEQLRSFIGPPLRGQFCKVCGLADEESARMVEDYREYYRDKGIFGNNVYDGVIEMLEKLRKKGFRLAIATSKPEMFAKQIADYFGFSKYFDFIGGACMNESRTAQYRRVVWIWIERRIGTVGSGNVSGSAGTDCLLDGSLIKTLHVVYKRNR